MLGPHNRIRPATLLVLILLAAGCTGSPADDPTPGTPTPTPVAPTPIEDSEDEDPLASAFKLQDSIASATGAADFGDVNPFGYRNPLRSI